MNNYCIVCLLGQRKCSYPGQYAPEVLAAMDDLGDADNPDYLNAEETKYRESNEFTSICRVIIKVPLDKIEACLSPKLFEINGNIA